MNSNRELIHGYFGVDTEIVWKTATERIPQLKPMIAEVINEENKKEKKRSSGK
jgi:uncharacterized protein with HEPN domain